MNLFDKISTQIKGIFHDSADSVATNNAGRTARQIVRDLDDQILKAKNSYTDVKATLTLIEKDIDTMEKEVVLWQARAEKAVSQSKDDLVKEALEEKRKVQSRLNATKNQRALLRPQIEQVEKHINDMVAKREDLANRADMMQANSDVANAVEKAATIKSGVGGKDYSGDFDQLERAVDKKMAKAEALNEMSPENKTESLNKKFADLDSVSIDDELAALKSGKK